MAFMTLRRMEHMRAVPTLLRVLLDTVPTSLYHDKGPPGSGRTVWPSRRSVDRVFLDWPGWTEYPGDIQDLIRGAVREAERLGLVRTKNPLDWNGRTRIRFVGYRPEMRLDCNPAPEAREQRRRHCGENCEHDDSCPFNRPTVSI
jgi:hypothetical protein